MNRNVLHFRISARNDSLSMSKILQFVIEFCFCFVFFCALSHCLFFFKKKDKAASFANRTAAFARHFDNLELLTPNIAQFAARLAVIIIMFWVMLNLLINNNT